jgi:hypothetical protein
LIRKPAKNSFFIVLLLIILASCGFKSNPVPYPATPDRKPITTNMEALSVGDTVVLKWNFQDKRGLINHINIERSEVGAIGNECKDCPRTFTGIGQINVKEGMPADKEQRALSYTDAKAQKGKIYNYRLMLCEENRNCSEASTTEINFR